MTIIIYILLAILVGVFASKKGRSGIGFTFLSLLLSPLIGLLIALIVSPIEENIVSKGDLKKCPKCKELIRVDASICKHCGSSLKEKEKKLPSREIKTSFENDTHYIDIYNYEDDDFETTKKELLNQYGSQGYSLVSIDTAKRWKLKNPDYARTYIQVTEKDDLIKVEAYNTQEPPRIFGQNNNTKKSSNNTERLIELSRLLEKNLITKEEFEKSKKELYS